MYEWGTAPPSAPTLEEGTSALNILITGTHDGADDLTYLSDSTADFFDDPTVPIEIDTDTVYNETTGESATVSHVTETTVLGTLSGDDWDEDDTYSICRNLTAGAKYRVKTTYVRKEGSTVVYESDPSDASDQIELTTYDYIKVTVVASSDSQITHIRFYRTANDGAIYYYESEEENTSGTYNLMLTDTQLAANDAIDDDHDRPPLGTVCAGPYFNAYAFIAKDNLLHWSKAKQYEYWPPLDYVEVSEPQDPIAAITEYNGTVYVATREKLLQIQGSGSYTFYPVPTSAFIGTYSKQVLTSIPNQGILHIGKDGLYLYNGTDNKLSILDPIFEQQGMDGLPNLDLSYIDKCWAVVFDHKLFFGYPSGATYPDTVVVLDAKTLDFFKYTYTTDFSTAIVDKTNNRLYVGDNSGYVWQLETGDVDRTTAIATTMQTGDLNLPTRKYAPAWAKYDAYCDGSDTLNASIEIDGSSVQTHALSDKDRETRPRLIANSTGNRVSMKFTGSGPNIRIYSIQELE